MNASFVRYILILIFLCVPVGLRAQSVESILCALQERVMVVDARVKYADPYDGHIIGTSEANLPKAQPVSWPGNLPAFPQEGTITSFSQALEALNAASRVFDEIKGQFLAYDARNSQFVNLRHWYQSSSDSVRQDQWWQAGGGSDATTFIATPILLPSVGIFTEANWREKLQLLASNINQLKALAWPVFCRTLHSDSFDYYSESVEDPNNTLPKQAEEIRKNAIDWRLDVPRLVASGYVAPKAYITDSYDHSNGTKGKSEVGFEWNFRAYSADVVPGTPNPDNPDAPPEADWLKGFHGTVTMDAVTGARVFYPELSTISAQPNTPKVIGDFQFFRGGAVFPFGDLTEAVAPQIPIAIGSLIRIAKPVEPTGFGATAGFQLGKYGLNQEVKNEVFALSVDDAAEQAFGLMGASVPSISSKRVLAPQLVQGYFKYSYPTTDNSYLTLYEYGLSIGGAEIESVSRVFHEHGTIGTGPGATDVYYQEEHKFRTLVKAVCLPRFSTLQTNPLPAHVFEHLPGDVEINPMFSDTIRIHVGRGLGGAKLGSNDDPNQIGWLGTRSDGFGSAIFGGGPSAFELLYQTDYKKYEGEPIGGKTFDSLAELPGNQDQTGWSSRFAYMADWASPRLKQVKGKDVLVDISYPTAYTKNIRFYWVKDVGPKGTNGLYTLPEGSSQTPNSDKCFKTIVIKNPTENAGLPSERFHLRVEEAGRFHEITSAAEVDPQTQVSQSVRRFRLGTIADGTTLQETVIRSPDTVLSEIAHWVVTDTQGTSSRQAEYEFRVPLPGADRIELRSIKTDEGDGPQTQTFEWSTPLKNGYGNYCAKLNKITWDGPNSWKDNGREVRFADNGSMSVELERVGEKYHESTYTWDGSTLTTRRIIKSSKDAIGGAEYAKEVAVYSNKFQQVDISVGDEPAASIVYSNAGNTVETFYPGGYRERSTWSMTDSGFQTTLASGWGAGYTSGTVQEASYSPFGLLVSRSTKVNGVLVESVTGDDFTGFGAPRKLIGLRNAETKVTYEETGLKWGFPTEVTSPMGIKRSYGWDWLLRPSSWSNGFEAFKTEYPELGKTSITSLDGTGTGAEITRDSSGGLKSLTQKVGDWSTVNLVPGKTSTIETFGRQKNLTVDVTGVMSNVGGGMGSRGAGFAFGVSAAGELYTEVVPKAKDESSRGYSVRTYYDQKGRPKRVERLGADDTQVTETWMYDDANRTVTYSPGAGPLAQTIRSSTSSDGAQLTVSKGASEYLRYTNSAAGSQLVRTTELFDDSTGTGAKWTEVSKEVYNPATGMWTSTPWSSAANTTSMTTGAPGTESTDIVAGGETGDTLSIKSKDGKPSAITGTINGLAVNLGVSLTKGVLTGISGTIAGKDVGLALGMDGRLLSLTGPRASQSFTYVKNSDESYSVKITGASSVDQSQTTTNTITEDKFGDLKRVFGSGSIPLSLLTDDNPTTGGSKTTLTVDGSSTSLLMSFNRAGSLIGKTYTGDNDGGGINESYSPAADGTLSGTSIQGPGGSAAITITETPTSRTTTYPDQTTVEEHFFNVGVRSSVSAPNDSRNFAYENLKLKTETHSSGPWAGWTVERLPDTKGRLGTLRMTNGSITREFSFGYDDYSRLSGSTSYAVDAGYSRKDPGTGEDTGQLQSLSRRDVAQRVLNTTWSYDGSGALAGVTNNGLGSISYGYSFPNRDNRHRITTRNALVGRSWTNLTYDNVLPNSPDAGHLIGATVGNGRTLSYSYDARGNRRGQGTAGSHIVNGLDQVSLREFYERGFGVMGLVHPDASVVAFHPFAMGGAETLPVTPIAPAIGEFSGYWNVPQSADGSKTEFASLVSARIRGTLPRAGTNDAVAEEELYFVIPPEKETFVADMAGRTKQDAFWDYQWYDAGRLRKMTRREGTFRRPNITSEVVEFVYDADGRRTEKTHTVTFSNKPTEIETSKVLWSGWLPVMEERSRAGQLIDRRLFQWGADLSGSLEGAGGIGGLVAIIEEKASGKVRTLLPIQDGLGNVTAVLDQATGVTVARYDYGPFGEPLGETGEVDACPFRFQTKWYDAESEHYYFGYRYYSPRLGRWLSRDPLGEEGGVNLYAYCGNDPVNRHDPTGLQIWADFRSLPNLDPSVRAALDAQGRQRGREMTLNDAFMLLRVVTSPLRPIKSLLEEGDPGPLANMVTGGISGMVPAAADSRESDRFVQGFKTQLTTPEGLLTIGYNAALLKLMPQMMTKFGLAMDPPPIPLVRKPSILEIERQSRQLLDNYYIENGGPTIAFGSAPEIISLWKGPNKMAGDYYKGGSYVRRNPAQEVLSGFDPALYPGKGPFFGVGNVGKVEALSWAKYWGNGLQEFKVLKSDFDALLERGVILSDDLYDSGISIHVPPDGLDLFNQMLLKGPQNVYYPPGSF